MKRERCNSERIRTRVRQKRKERCKSGRLRAGENQEKGRKRRKKPGKGEGIGAIRSKKLEQE
jgi:hypothetical protein